MQRINFFKPNEEKLQEELRQELRILEELRDLNIDLTVNQLNEEQKKELKEKFFDSTGNQFRVTTQSTELTEEQIRDLKAKYKPTIASNP